MTDFVGEALTIKIEQKCDKCKQTRDLKMNGGGDRLTLSDVAMQGGWRKIDQKDICNNCLAEFLGDI